MSGQEIAALVVAITGALAAIFAGIRNLRGDAFKREVEASAALLTGYTNMVSTLQAEIDRLKSDSAEDREGCAEERARLREEHAKEMERQRAEHREEIARLRLEHRTELQVAYERIDELGAKVWNIEHRPAGTRARETD